MDMAVLAQLEMQTGNHGTAAAMLREAIALARGTSDLYLLGYSLNILAVTSVYLNDVPVCLASAKEGAIVARQSGDQTLLLMALSMLLWAESVEGNQAAVQTVLDELRQVVPSTYHPFTAYALLGGGSQARWRGDLDTARFYLEQGAALSPRLKSRFYEAAVRSELAHISRQSGDYIAAQKSYRQTILTWKDLGHRAAVANQLEYLAFIARAQEKPPRAARLLGAAEVVREASGAPMTTYEQAEYARQVAALRAQLDADSLAAEWGAGRAMTMEQAIAYALEPVEPH